MALLFELIYHAKDTYHAWKYGYKGNSKDPNHNYKGLKGAGQAQWDFIKHDTKNVVKGASEFVVDDIAKPIVEAILPSPKNLLIYGGATIVALVVVDEVYKKITK